MDYEKMYKDALYKAKMWSKNTAVPQNVKVIFEQMFPELKESEDERIRKGLICFLTNLLDQGGMMADGWDSKECEEYIAWLEKQGSPAKLSEEEQNRIDKGILSSCALSFIHYLDAHKYEGKMCVSNGECEDIENAFHNAMWDRLHRYYCKYIEKQDEQNPTNKIEPKFKVKYACGEYNVVDEKDIAGVTFYGIEDEPNHIDYVKADTCEIINAKPKFKVGDWICNVISLRNISSIENEMYYFDEGDVMPIAFVDKYYNLWTINDAEEGDVVVDKSNEVIGIFQSIGHHPDGGSYNDPSYCFLHCRYDNGFFYADFEHGNMIDSDDLIPATKEQRDLLFQEMREAGYKWDSEKKELKKVIIEPKFKVGDWVVQENIGVYKVIEICNLWYEVIDLEDNHYSIPFVKECMCHLWSINDAKDGDVLTVNGRPFIYCCYDDYQGNYCCIDSNGEFRTTFDFGFNGKTILPATKEQRDILFAKMKEEGYEWDADEKELKKMEGGDE